MSKDKKHVDAVLLDGYIDEPALLGVPPYISPYPRLIAGVLEESGISYVYITVDQYREKGLPPSEIVIVHGGTTVPGRYLGGTPLSTSECIELGRSIGHRETYLGGPLARQIDDPPFHHAPTKDLCAYLYDSFSGDPRDRWATGTERERWSLKGARMISKHPSFPDTVIPDIITYRGCIRYYTGGCSFCSEPGYGRPEMREQSDIIQEISTLYELGVRHFRLGGQSCIISYKAQGIGKTEAPVPSPEELEKLFSGINYRCPDIKVLHVDNANPSVMAAHPGESREILNILVEHTTPGNVLALGMESADPKVIKANNLNSTPEEVLNAIKMIYEVGADCGVNGMPKLLPGINILAGLEGETPDTFAQNYIFLKKILDSGLLLRRINIRQVQPHRLKVKFMYPGEFRKFKTSVREDIDRPMLKKIIPAGTVLRDVHMELHRGKQTFGRQIGTYPILVGVEYSLDIGKPYDIMITGHGYRSITGVHHPFYIDQADFSQLSSIPGIGDKRAASIFVKRPRSADELESILGDAVMVEQIMKYTSFSR